jgi:hypothetical protein
MTEIVRAGPEVLGELRPLWLALRDHHADVMPHLGPPRDPMTPGVRDRDERQASQRTHPRGRRLITKRS